jgi:serine/threonine protein kinase
LLTAFAAVCNTVAFAHSRGVLHRDLKADNVILVPTGETLGATGLAPDGRTPRSNTPEVKTVVWRTAPLAGRIPTRFR